MVHHSGVFRGERGTAMLPIWTWTQNEVATLGAATVAVGGGLVAAASSPDYMGQAALVTAYTGMLTGIAGLISVVGLTAGKLYAEWRKGGQAMVSIEAMTAEIKKAVAEAAVAAVADKRAATEAVAVAAASASAERKANLAAIKGLLASTAGLAAGGGAESEGRLDSGNHESSGTGAGTAGPDVRRPSPAP